MGYLIFEGYPFKDIFYLSWIVRHRKWLEQKKNKRRKAGMRGMSDEKFAR